MSWKGKKVLVTGANGFIGAWLCSKLLEKEAKVIATVHENDGLLGVHGIQDKIKTVLFDVADAESVNKAFEEGPEICFHLAAKSSTRDASKDLTDTFKTNVMGTLNIANAAKEKECALVFVSSVKTYGGQTESCFNEDEQLKGTSAYATSKIAAEAICKMFSNYPETNIAIARLSNIFGGKDNNYSRLVPGAIKKVKEGNAPQVLGTGESMLDLLYTEDAVNGLLLLGEKMLAEEMKAETFNFGSGKWHSVREIVGKISELMGSEIKPEFSGTENPCKECMCIEKAKKELNWEPKYTFESGLEKTIEYFEKVL